MIKSHHHVLAVDMEGNSHTLTHLISTTNVHEAFEAVISFYRHIFPEWKGDKNEIDVGAIYRPGSTIVSHKCYTPNFDEDRRVFVEIHTSNSEGITAVLDSNCELHIIPAEIMEQIVISPRIEEKFSYDVTRIK